MRCSFSVDSGCGRAVSGRVGPALRARSFLCLRACLALACHCSARLARAGNCFALMAAVWLVRGLWRGGWVAKLMWVSGVLCLCRAWGAGSVRVLNGRGGFAEKFSFGKLQGNFRGSSPVMGSEAGTASSGVVRGFFGLRLKRGHGERLPVRGAGAGPCSLPGKTSLRMVLHATTFCRNSSEKGSQPQAVRAVSGGFGVIRASRLYLSWSRKRSNWRSSSLRLASRYCFVMGVT